MNRHHTLRLDYVAVAVVLSFVLLIIAESQGISLPLIRPLVTLLLAGLVPGALVLSLLRIRPQPNLKWFSYAVGLSFMITMALWGGLNVLLLAVEYREPLSLEPLAIATAVFVLLGASGVALQNRKFACLSLPVVRDHHTVRTGLAILSLIPVSILTLNYLNTTSEALPLIGVLIIIGITPLAAVTERLPARWHPLAIWTMALTMLYYSTMSWGSGFSGHTYIISAWRAKRWIPTDYSLVPNAVVFPAYARLSGVDIITELLVINPIWVALIPTVMYVIFREYTTTRRAFLGACMFVFAHPFYFLYPSGGRVSTPVFFLVLVGLTIVDSEAPTLQRRLLSLVFASGIIVSHYGTAYFIMFVALTSVALLVAYRRIDRFVLRWIPDHIRPDGTNGQSSSQNLLRTAASGRPKVITMSFGLFFTSLTMAWYVFTWRSKKFEGLILRIIDSIYSLFFSTQFGGGTANRIQANYGTMSIQLSKYIYLLLAGFMAIGIISIYFRRLLINKSNEFNDEYLTVASTLLAVFSTSLFLPDSWGGGRPMMITFSLTAVFAVMGATEPFSIVAEVIERVSLEGLPRDRVARWLQSVASFGVYAFAVLLLLHLLLNTGVMAALVFGGAAPTNVVLKDQIENSDNPRVVSELYQDSDLRTHIWFAKHRNPKTPIYADKATRAQAHDWYNPMIKTEVPSSVSIHRIKLKNNLLVLNGSGVERGYVFLMGHNVATGKTTIKRVGVRSLAPIQPELRARDVIYTTGKSRIYYANST